MNQVTTPRETPTERLDFDRLDSILAKPSGR